jgi:tetratricopeptide (TPR) repeat protein
MERGPDAERQHRLAMKVRQALVEGGKANPYYRANLASTYTNLANLCPGPVSVKEAEELFKKSIEIQKVLVEQQREVDQHVLDYAMSYNNLGLLYWRHNRRKEAEAPWLKALRIRVELLKRRPGLPDGLSGLAMSHGNLGMLYHRNRKDYPNAQTSYRAAVKAGKELVDARPAVVQYALELAKSYLELGRVSQDQDKYEPAIEEYKQALKALAPWSGRDLEHLPSYGRQVLLDSHHFLAAALSRQTRFREALPHWNRAVALAGPKERHEIRANRALALAESGAYREAVDEAIELAGRPRIRPDELFQIARVHALSSSAAGKDTELAEQRRKDLADLYARRCLAVLGEVHKAGLFKDAQHRKTLKESKQFAGLREREEFRKLLASIEAR